MYMYANSDVMRGNKLSFLPYTGMRKAGKLDDIRMQRINICTGDRSCSHGRKDRLSVPLNMLRGHAFHLLRVQIVSCRSFRFLLLVSIIFYQSQSVKDTWNPILERQKRVPGFNMPSSTNGVNGHSNGANGQSNGTHGHTSALCSVDEFTSQQYDYLVIGGGTAGLVVAARLTEDPNITVGVLEAGGNRMDDKNVLTPTLYPTLIGRKEYDWLMTSVPQVCPPFLACQACMRPVS